MIKILRTKPIDILNIYKMLHNINTEKLDFYSEFNKSIANYIIMGRCYYIIKNNLILALLLINKRRREIFYIPTAENNISLFRLVYTLNTVLDLKDYTFSIRHKSLNPLLYKKYFPVDIAENYKYMYINTYKSFTDTPSINGNIFVRRMTIGVDEPVRVKLQNNIFGNNAGRKNLTLLEVYNEEKRNTFLKDMCFILDVEGTPGGYGQILIIDRKYFLVNFGIIAEYRGKGYGSYFLSEIINNCRLAGIEHLNLCVDNNNIPAVNLYKKTGFKELYNKFNIIFR